MKRNVSIYVSFVRILRNVYRLNKDKTRKTEIFYDIFTLVARWCVYLSARFFHMFTRADVFDDDDKDGKKAARREIAKRMRCKLRIYAIVPEHRSRTTRRSPLETDAKRRMESDITSWIEKRRYLTPETRRMQKRFGFLAILSFLDHKRYLVFVARRTSTS